MKDHLPQKPISEFSSDDSALNINKYTHSF